MEGAAVVEVLLELEPEEEDDNQSSLFALETCFLQACFLFVGKPSSLSLALRVAKDLT